MQNRPFPGQSKRTSDLRSSIEPLEARIAPAGAVHAAYDPITGLLSVTGDSEANGVQIVKMGPNHYAIQGVGTSVNGSEYAGRITAITFDMGGGDDAVEMVDVKNLKTLEFVGRDGNDTFEAKNFSTSGAVDFDLGKGEDLVKFTGIATVIGSHFSVPANAGGSRVEFLADSTTIFKNLFLEGGDGDDGILLGQDSSLRVGGGVTVLGEWGGNDYVDFEHGKTVNLGKNADGLALRFKGGGSDFDRVAVGGERVVFVGGVQIVGSSDTTTGDQFSFGSRTSPGELSPTNVLRIGKDRAGISIFVDALEGNDSLSLAASSGILSGGVVYVAGDGNNEFRVLNSGTITIGKIRKNDVSAGMSAGQSIAYTGGTGDDALNLNAVNLTLAGFLGVKGGDGENELSVFATNAIKLGKAPAFGGSLIYDGGSEEDSVTLSSPNVSLASFAHVSTNEGNDFFFIHSASAFLGTVNGPLFGNRDLSIAFNSGLGDDTFALTSERVIAKGHLVMGDEFTFAGNVDENDLFTVNSASFQGAGVAFTGSQGDDTFEMNVDRLALSSLWYQSGGGSDSISIHADGRVKHVAFGFGRFPLAPNPGQSQVNIGRSTEDPKTSLVLGRPVPPGELRTDFSVSFIANDDNGFGVLFQDITFQNTLSINSGAGDNTVVLDNIQALDGLSIWTGTGADVVEIERGSRIGPSTFKKPAYINLGAGDDIVRIGSTVESPTDNFARFLGGLSLMGDDGTDSMNSDLTSANEIVGTPVIEIEEQDA